MKKMIAATVMAGGIAITGASLVHADYPDEEQVSPVPPADAPAAPPSAPESPSPGGTLPASGGESMMLLQIGLVTVAAGGTLVGAAALRRRRLTA